MIIVEGVMINLKNKTINNKEIIKTSSIKNITRSKSISKVKVICLKNT